MNENSKEFLKALGLRIKTLRTEKGWSQDELAKRCGYSAANSRSTISKIEKGTNDVPASQLKILAKALGTTACDLLNEAIQVQEELAICELFEQCRNSSAFTTIQNLLKLDAEDRIRIDERIKQMLEEEKYSIKKESLDT